MEVPDWDTGNFVLVVATVRWLDAEMGDLEMVDTELGTTDAVLGVCSFDDEAVRVTALYTREDRVEADWEERERESEVAEEAWLAELSAAVVGDLVCVETSLDELATENDGVDADARETKDCERGVLPEVLEGACEPRVEELPVVCPFEEKIEAVCVVALLVDEAVELGTFDELAREADKEDEDAGAPATEDCETVRLAEATYVDKLDTADCERVPVKV